MDRQEFDPSDENIYGKPEEPDPGDYHPAPEEEPDPGDFYPAPEDSDALNPAAPEEVDPDDLFK